MLRYSIIIAVYNVEPYLRECLDSVLAQDSRSEYEVIMIDDGSSDRSGAICDEYAASYAQFRAIHQENRGPSAAKNAGMDAAAGEFVLFLDSDDLWYPQMLSCMDEFAEEAPDMLLFPFETFDKAGNKQIVRPEIPPLGESGMEYLQRCFDIKLTPPPSGCGCMFRRGFLEENHLRFCVGLLYEDSEFSLHTFPAARSVMGTDQILYRYRVQQRNESIMTNFSIEKWYHSLTITLRWFERFPNSATANYYCATGTVIASLGSKVETAEIVERFAQRKDILALVSGPVFRFARLLFHVFGYYNGSKLFLRLQKAKHAILRRKG